jgi:hypothetical protein
VQRLEPSLVKPFVVTFRTASCIRFHLSFKVSGSGSDAPDSSAFYSWRYSVATFPSFKRSLVERLSCCGAVLLARLILYLNFMITSMWSESIYSSIFPFILYCLIKYFIHRRSSKYVYSTIRMFGIQH